MIAAATMGMLLLLLCNTPAQTSRPAEEGDAARAKAAGAEEKGDNTGDQAAGAGEKADGAGDQAAGAGMQGAGAVTDVEEGVGEGGEIVAASSARAGGVATAMPPVSAADLDHLARLARRSFEAALEGKEVGWVYRPAALAGVTGAVHLTARVRGRIVAEARTAGGEVVEGSLEAGRALAAGLAARGIVPPDAGRAWGLEWEWVGPWEFVDVGYARGETWSREMLYCFEPGVEGIGVCRGEECGWTRPGEMLARNYSPDLAIQQAESQIGLTREEKKAERERRVKSRKSEVGSRKLEAGNKDSEDGKDRGIRYFRFQTRLLWQADAGSVPVLLTRGTVPLGAEAVTAEGLDAAIERLGGYLCYRQMRSGWFAQVFLPSADLYAEVNDGGVQMRALEGLAAYAAWSRDGRVVEDVAKVVRGVREAGLIRPLVVPGLDAGGQLAGARAGEYLELEGFPHPLEHTARLLGAVTYIYWEREFDGLRGGLVGGLLASQDGDGRLEMVFGARPPAERERDAEAGQALLALVESERWKENAGVRLVLRRARAFYQPRFREGVSPEAAAAFAQALGRAYVRTREPELAGAAFELCDRFVAAQLDAANCPWPDVLGAVAARGPGMIGADSAGALAALAGGLSAARLAGDAAREQRYRAATAAAARFVMQLMVREPDCFYVRTPRDALGGVRTAPWDNRLQIDHAAGALIALIRAREALFGERR